MHWQRSKHHSLDVSSSLDNGLASFPLSHQDRVSHGHVIVGYSRNQSWQRTICKKLRSMSCAPQNPQIAKPRRSHAAHPSIERTRSIYNPLQSFVLPKGDEKHYQQQYSDIYFLRLAQLKPVVEEVGKDAWSDFEARKLPEQYNKYLLSSVSLGSWREGTESGPCPRCTSRRSLLGSRDDIHGHAVKAKYP